MGSIQSSPYDNHVYPVTYSISTVATNNSVASTKWVEIFNAVNTERARRGYGAIANPDFSVGTVYTASDLNALVTGLNTAGYTDGFGGVSIDATVYAQNINDMISKVIAAGAVCVCNCAYCTCNCNYCTCNCDYSCTCNCNYSDERLKTNIKLIGKQSGINIYSFNYIWNKSRIEYGVMAQEILNTKYKHAVVTDKNGFYMVNYSKLPINMKGI